MNSRTLATDTPTLMKLIKRCQNGEQFEYLPFWGHTPSKDGRIRKASFSQWYVAPFTIEVIVYQTTEHWMMAGKARLFSDDETLQEILVAPDPKSAKALGRKVRSFRDDVWVANARRIVTEGNIAKFSQNEE